MAVRINPSRGGKPDKLIRDALMLELMTEAQDANGEPTKRLRLLCRRWVDKAIEGDVPAMNGIADRVDGKPTQPIAGDDDADAIRLELIKRVIVDPRNSDG